MPDVWDSAVYRERAAAWRKRALQLAENDAARHFCVSIATDYESLARTLEERERQSEAAKPEVYWQRAATWRERALLLAEGDAARDISVNIAADYEVLARTLEERERLAKPAPASRSGDALHILRRLRPR